MWKTFEWSEDPFSTINNFLWQGKVPLMWKVLHGTSNANIEPLFIRIKFCSCDILYVVYVVLWFACLLQSKPNWLIPLWKVSCCFEAWYIFEMLSLSKWIPLKICTAYNMWHWSTKPGIGCTVIFVAIANNTLYGSKLLMFFYAKNH